MNQWAEPMASVDFALIIGDNEKAVRLALQRGDHVQAFLLVHSLVESLLRIFLARTRGDEKFQQLVQAYRVILEQESPGITSFVEELTQFNRRRNRIVHELWRKGYTYTNHHARDAATSAVAMYGLLVEFVQTYDPTVAETGFRLD